MHEAQETGQIVGRVGRRRHAGYPNRPSKIYLQGTSFCTDVCVCCSVLATPMHCLNLLEFTLWIN